MTAAAAWKSANIEAIKIIIISIIQTYKEPFLLDRAQGRFTGSAFKNIFLIKTIARLIGHIKTTVAVQIKNMVIT